MGKKTESLHLLNHSKCMMAAFQNFRQDESMLDVTLACNGSSLKAHKLVLSACSPFFKDLFAENPCTHPIIILRNFEFSDLKAVIDFIYKGELSVPRERLMSALKVAEELHVRGLRRSEPNREKYEKLYNQVRGKLSSRKKRKRHRRNSSESENEFLNLSDSDENVMESDDSLCNTKMPSESQPMDLKTRHFEEMAEDDIDLRPVVLRVGEPATDNDESISKNTLVEEESVMPGSAENSLSETHLYGRTANSCEENDIQSFDSMPENVASNSQVDSFTTSHENVSLLDVALTDEQASSQAETSEERSGASYYPPETSEHTNNETESQGKSFICSQCNIVFTSRINFLRHKMLGHTNSKEIHLYKCEYCSFSTEECDSLETHILTHKVPSKCNMCSQEFDSEDLYNEHLFMHKTLKTSHEPSLSEELFPPQNKSPETPVMYRCSVCLTKFPSKLSCQIHERMCQGGSS